MAERRKGDKNNEPRSATLIVVRVVPRSSKRGITEEAHGIFKIRLTAPPVDGAANTQLVKLLSEKLSLPVRNIQLVSGKNTRLKRLEIRGMDLHHVSERLAKA